MVDSCESTISNARDPRFLLLPLRFPPILKYRPNKICPTNSTQTFVGPPYVFFLLSSQRGPLWRPSLPHYQETTPRVITGVLGSKQKQLWPFNVQGSKKARTKEVLQVPVSSSIGWEGPEKRGRGQKGLQMNQGVLQQISVLRACPNLVDLERGGLLLRRRTIIRHKVRPVSGCFSKRQTASRSVGQRVTAVPSHVRSN